VSKYEDQVDQGLEQLLVEEQEKVESEMRAGMAKARLLTFSATLSTHMCRRLFGKVWDQQYQKQRRAAC
jgi:hypothetical protein